MGYARSAKVGFELYPENMDAIDRAATRWIGLSDRREANNQLSLWQIACRFRD